MKPETFHATRWCTVTVLLCFLQPLFKKYSSAAYLEVCFHFSSSVQQNACLFLSVFLSSRSRCLCPLGEFLSVLQGLTDIHTDANDTVRFEALRSRLSPNSPYLLLLFISATSPLVLASWAIRQREKSQLVCCGNQTSFSCPFNIGINFLQG